ncbi:MAG: BrnT family toxin [Proteobacteria bacterium]|nr:MAG: BrnT family toxin [Pseudomonadota bacterium]
MLEFVWDERKNRANRSKHGIWFEEARQVFHDPRALKFYDSENSVTEDRFLLLGESEPNRVLMIVFCERDGTDIRIISARKATKKERNRYEEGI